MSFWRRSAPGSDTGRWLVVDVEASGLDMRRDRLLAIAGVALQVQPQGAPRIRVADSFEVVLRHDEAPVDRANILLHGIGVGAQRAGVPAAEAIAAFEAWTAGAPLVAFHAAFDETLIARTTLAALGRRAPHRWLDLAQLAPMAWPQVQARALDDWLAHAGIACLERHRATADALATAELLQVLWPALAAQGLRADWASLAKLAAQSRWLPRGA
jgi:DNA polymerase-3 subunit epsilon